MVKVTVQEHEQICRRANSALCIVKLTFTAREHIFRLPIWPTSWYTVRRGKNRHVHPKDRRPIENLSSRGGMEVLVGVP